MQFMSRGGNRNNMQPQTSTNPNPTMQHSAHHPSGRRKHIDWAARTVRLELFTVIVGSALLLAAVSLYLAFSGNLGSEAKQVKTDKWQAVFLNGGATSGPVQYSTYFGHITSLNNKYFVLRDIYYLTSNQQTQSAKTSNNNVQLTKLGCQQLHSPYDQMVINRDQVAFWENIKDDGKVVQAIKQYQKQNPNGPNCSASGSSTTPTAAPSSSTGSGNGQ